MKNVFEIITTVVTVLFYAAFRYDDERVNQTGD